MPVKITERGARPTNFSGSLSVSGCNIHQGYLQWYQLGTHQRGRLQSTIGCNYQADLRSFDANIQPEWEDAVVAENLRMV